jgi:tetratricopeptide (TPR) repeat protein
MLKKLSFQLQSYHETTKILEEIHNELSIKKKEEERVLGHLISYAEHQFGDRVLGKAYRERGSGECIDNWTVEILILVYIYIDMIDANKKNGSLSMVASDNITLPYYQKMLELLRPWSIYLDKNCNGHIDSLDKDQINRITFYFSQTECNIGMIHQHRNEFVLAEDHCQRALSYARMYGVEEEEKTHLLSSALNTLYALRRDQGNYIDALTFAEESYDCVAIAYNPVHPKVQEAASALIECLIAKGDFYDAERFSQATLDSLKDSANGLDQQSEAVAKGYHDLGHVIYNLKEDFAKAETLVRESLRIRTSLYDAYHTQVAMSAGLLASILQSQGNLGSETKELRERSLVSDTRHSGPEGINTAISNFNLGNFYHLRADGSQTAEMRKENLLLSKSKYKEALRIYTKALGPDNPRTKELSSIFSLISRKLSEV